jgi:hypothetical protein
VVSYLIYIDEANIRGRIPTYDPTHSNFSEEMTRLANVAERILAILSYNFSYKHEPRTLL